MINFIKNYKKLKLDNFKMLDEIIARDYEIKHLKEHIENDKFNLIFVVVEPDCRYYVDREIVKIFKYKKDAKKYIKNHPYKLQIDEHELE
jgi:hypothetical protein